MRSVWRRRRHSPARSAISTSDAPRDCTAGMNFTYRNPERSTDPGRALKGAREHRRGRARLPPTRRDADGRPGRRVRRRRPLRRIACRARGGGRSPARRRPRRACAGRRQRARRSRGCVPRRSRLVRQEHATCCCRVAAAGSCSARSSPTPRCGPTNPSPTAAGRAAVASTVARPARSSRPVSSTRAAASRGCCRRAATSRSSSAKRSAIASTAATSARRCAPRIDEPVRPSTLRRRASTSSTCSRPTTTTLLRASRPLVHRGSRPSLPAPQRAGRARQHRDSPTIRRRARRSSVICDDADPMLRAHAAWAAGRVAERAKV